VSNITERLQLVKSTFQTPALAKIAYETFKAYTPVRTGNAKNNTNLSGGTINANYPYALELDNGSSKKAPAGMTVPTIQVLREHVRRALGIDLVRGAPSQYLVNNRLITSQQTNVKKTALAQTNTAAFVKGSIPVKI